MGRECLSRLYIGHLPADTSEDDFRTFLLNGGQLAKNSFSITVKKGYAFMQCCDQGTADLVIDRFHGATYHGSVICIEPAVSNYTGATVKLGRCLMTIKKMDADGSCEGEGSIQDLEKILDIWGGNVLSMEKMGSSKFVVTVADTQTMADLISRCNEMTSDGHGLIVKAEAAPENLKPANIEVVKKEPEPAEVSSSTSGSAERENSEGRTFRPRFSGSRPFHPRNFASNGFRGSRSPRWNGAYEPNPNFPWRMLVPAAQVGALIGKAGGTIRQITQSTGARVNIHTGQGGARNRGDVEKVLSIVGTPESCTAACRQILEILAQDLSKTFGAELALRLIAFDSLIGRVIGKGGTNITKIMQETNTRIHISNIHDPSRHALKYRYDDCDRIITIRGSIGGMVQAEAMVSHKLRTSYESDIMHPQDHFPPIGYFHHRQY